MFPHRDGIKTNSGQPENDREILQRLRQFGRRTEVKIVSKASKWVYQMRYVMDLRIAISHVQIDIGGDKGTKKRCYLVRERKHPFFRCG